LAHVIERCLAIEPDDRWQSATDVAAELEWSGKNPVPVRSGLKLQITLGEGTVSIRNAVRDVLQRGAKKIMLNLADINYIDSSGVGELVSTYTTVVNGGGQWKLLSLTKKLRDLLTITKLLTIFDISDDEKAALTRFR
jgi:anti-sigma B factor antagonist